jgi:hypothetical protein
MIYFVQMCQEHELKKKKRTGGFGWIVNELATSIVVRGR